MISVFGSILWRPVVRLGAGMLLLLCAGGLRAQSCSVDTIASSEIGAAMRVAARAHGDYDILATTNATRFQTALIFELIRRDRARHPEGNVIFISADAIFFEFLEVADLADEPENAPLYRQLAYQHEQNILIEHRPDSIVKSVLAGPSPALSLNVKVAWHDRPDGKRKYSFTDTLAVPKLKVTNHQVITYRMLDYGTMVMYDEVKGLSGRPLSGVLGALFALIGEGGVKYSRTAYSDDGMQILRAQAKKIFTKTATLTIHPDGRAEKDVPEERADLVEIAERLEQKIDLEYHPYRCW